MKSLKEIALNACKHGMSVMPLWPNTKNPILSEWKEFQTKRATEEQINTWWDRNPDANIAIITGSISGITVVDFDVKKEKINGIDIVIKENDKAIFKSDRYKQFPQTKIVRTWSGGLQYYYKYTNQIAQGANVYKDDSGVDIRNDGGYVVAPGSVVNGEKYVLAINDEFQDFPIHLFPKIEKKSNFDLSSVIEGVTHGSRNETAAQVIGKFIQKFPEDIQTAFELACLWNNKNNPPLSDRELRTVFSSILKRDKSKSEREIKEKVEELESSFNIVSLTNLVERSMIELDATKPEDCIGFGYDWLDDKLTGLFPGELVVLGGESGTGKTTFATNIIYKASKKNKAAIIALEDRLNDYGIKAIYFELGRVRAEKGLKNYPWNDYRKNQIDDLFYKSFRQEAESRVKNDNVLWVEVKQQMSIELLEVIIEQMVKDGTNLFLVDHLHYFDLLKGESSKADYIESVMVKMKTMQNRNGARIILIAHYKKLDGKKPTIDSFKDGISISQNANYIIHLWRDRSADADRTKTKVFIQKSRNPNGEANIEVEYNPDTNDYVCPDYELEKKWGFGGHEGTITNNQIKKI
jgi:replicative DNA helicase